MGYLIPAKLDPEKLQRRRRPPVRIIVMAQQLLDRKSACDTENIQRQVNLLRSTLEMLETNRRLLAWDKLKIRTEAEGQIHLLNGFSNLTQDQDHEKGRLENLCNELRQEDGVLQNPSGPEVAILRQIAAIIRLQEV